MLLSHHSREFAAKSLSSVLNPSERLEESSRASWCCGEGEDRNQEQYRKFSTIPL